jgi:hypothetical protein
MPDQDNKPFTTSDVNFAAYLSYRGNNVSGTNVTHEGGRVRVWFMFDMNETEYNRNKNDFFSQSEMSSVIAQKLFQERERIYSLMIQVRNQNSAFKT